MATAVTYGDISPRTAGYVMKKMLERGIPKLVFDTFSSQDWEDDGTPESERELAEMEKIWEEFPTEHLDWGAYWGAVVLNEEWMDRIEVACTS